jgi:hypothetical protein
MFSIVHSKIEDASYLKGHIYITCTLIFSMYGMVPTILHVHKSFNMFIDNDDDDDVYLNRYYNKECYKIHSLYAYVKTYGLSLR